MLKSELPYPGDNDLSRLFAPLAGQPWSIWLDSGTDPSMAGRFDIMVAQPRTTLVTREGVTRISSNGCERQERGDPFELLRQALGCPGPRVDNDLPFSGGAVGYFGYDLGRLLMRLPQLALDEPAVPQMAIGIYDWAVVCDRQRRRCWLTSNSITDEYSTQWQDLLALLSKPGESDTKPSPLIATGPVQANLDTEHYRQAFQAVKHYLTQGDCYQVNLAQRFSMPAGGDPWQGYRRLRNKSGGPFSAYLNLPDLQILSTSPERFLLHQDGDVQTRPIKGTRRRAEDPVLDRTLATELASSAKDRAENVMIVDLLRNDLGKSCRPGSVKVSELFRVESFATVHHLVSTVEGRLADGEDALTLLRCSFPGGSITGAPKQRAMEIIEELEPHRRGVYCGSIGYIGFDGRMDTSIAIRTAINTGGKLYYAAGGGIVSDSVCADEYQETFDKAAAFLTCFTPRAS